MSRFSLAVTTTSLLTLGGLVSQVPAIAFSIDLTSSDWQTFGDVNVTATGTANLSTALNGETGNFSGNDPLGTSNQLGTLETILGFAPGDLDPDPFDVVQEGSGLRNNSLVANAGDVLSFDWTFLTNDSPTFFNLGDYAFVDIRPGLPLDLNNPLAGVVTSPLSSSLDPNFLKQANGNFSFTFASGGTFDVVVGVVDVGGTAGASALSIKNLELTTPTTPVPEPSSVIGTLVAGAFLLNFKMKGRKINL